MKIKTKELLDILDKLKPLNKGAFVIRSEFIFMKNIIAVYNSRIYAQYPFDSDLEFVVSTNEFYNIINGIEDKELEITKIDSKDKIKIKSNSVKSTLSISYDNDINDIVKNFDIDRIKRWRKVSDDFSDALSLCSISISKNKYIVGLDCIFVDDREVISSDEYRISRYRLDKRMRESFLLLGSVVRDIARQKITRFFIGDSLIYLKDDKDGIYIFSKTDKEDMRAFENLMELFEFEGDEIKLPDDLKKAVDTVAVLADGDSYDEKNVEVKIKDKKIVCKSERDIGDILFEKDIDFKGKALFYINPTFFSNILEKTRKMVIGEDRALFKMKNFDHLISLPTEE